MKRQHTLKQKILFLTASIFIGILLIVILIIVPSVRYIYTIKNTIEFTESRMEEQYQRIRLLKKSINELDTIREHVAEFETSMITDGDELSVIRLLEQLAQTHDVSQQFKLSASDNSNTLSFDFSVTGSYQRILAYIRGLEVFPYYVSIERMVLHKPTKDTNNYVTATFSAAIFRK